MSFLNYHKMAETTDVRVVKTRRTLYEALIRLLEGKLLGRITVKELCACANINRSTFYLHFRSVHDVYSSWLSDMADEYLRRMEDDGIIGYKRFNAREFIVYTHVLVEKHKSEFGCIYKNRENDDLYRVLGTKTGNFAKRLLSERGESDDSGYTFSLVFTVNGLVMSYVDWWDMGRQITLEYLSDLAEMLCARPLDQTINPQIGSAL